MDERTERILTLILYTSLLIINIFLLLQNIVNPWSILLVSGCLVMSITIRNVILYNSEEYKRIGKITILIDIIMICLLVQMDRGGSSSALYYIIISDAVLTFSTLYSSSVLFACLISYSFLRFNGGMYELADVLPVTLPFAAVYAFMFIVKHLVIQSVKLRETMLDVKIKSKQLENAYLKLKETSEELEEMTILKERNRIAREIHDTVGHTLTTVLLEMEAGERLIAVDPMLAVEKIRLAKGQVRKGLNDIRHSVYTLQSGKEIMEFTHSLKLLIEETIKHGNIHIKYNISKLPKLAEAHEKTIYRALQEGLTNGIRHGGSTAFVFQLKYEDNCLDFNLQDNGKGTEKIIVGFGLAAMEERVKELGGVISTSSSPGEGFDINIKLPLGKGNMYEYNQSISG